MYEINIKKIIRHHSINRHLNDDPTKCDKEVKKGEKNTFLSIQDQTQGNFSKGQSDDQKLTHLRMGNTIPPELLLAFPSLNKVLYQKLRDSHSFLEKPLPVCEECYLYFTSLDFKGGAQEADRRMLLDEDVKFKGTGNLKPETLKIRHEDTVLRIQTNEVEKYHRVRKLVKYIDNEMRLFSNLEELEAQKTHQLQEALAKTDRSKLITQRISKKISSKLSAGPEEVFKLMLEKHKMLVPIIREANEKTAELLDLKVRASHASVHLSRLEDRKISLPSHRKEPQKAAEKNHQKLKSISLADRLGLKTVLPSACEELSTHPTTAPPETSVPVKSRSQRFQSFSKGISKDVMVGFEGSIFSNLSTEETSAIKKQRSYRLLDLRKSKRESSGQLFTMYNSKRQVN